MTRQGDLVVPVVIFGSKDDNWPQPYSVPWLSLAQRLCTYEERLAKDGHAWSPVTYRPGSARGKANVDQVHMLVLDVDHTELPLDLLNGLEYVAHTTFNHTPQDPRWRVILPLSEPISGQSWPGFWLRANAYFGGCIDRQTKDSSRIFYLPSCRPGGQHEAKQQHGDFLEPSRLPELPIYEPTPIKRKSADRADTSLDGWADQFCVGRLNNLASMQRGERNAECNRLAYLLGGLIADGRHGMNSASVTEWLLGACEQNGLINDDGERSVLQTINSGLDSGLLHPWSPADQSPPERRNGHSKPAAQAQAISGPRILTGPQLAARIFDAPKWAIPTLLPVGLTLVAGRPKIGKSWLLLGWALDIARGMPALRKLALVQGDALYLALEDNERRIQERMALMLGDVSAPERFHVATDWPRLNEGGLEYLENWINAHPGARMVGIDTLKRIRPIEKGNARLYDLDYDSLAPLQALAIDKNLSVSVAHHTRKGESSDPLELISGSLGLSAVVDTAMVLKRERGQADAGLHAIGRDLEEDLELALKLENTSTLGWSLMGRVDEFRSSKERRDVLVTIKQQPGMKAGEIAQAMDRTAGPLRALLFKMVNDRDVRRDEDNRYFPPVTEGSPLTTSVDGVDGDAVPSTHQRYQRINAINAINVQCLFCGQEVPAGDECSCGKR